MSKKPITVPHPHYQPSKAELEQDMRVKANPKQAVKAIVKDVRIEHSHKPKWMPDK